MQQLFHQTQMEIPPCNKCDQRKANSIFCCLLSSDLSVLSEEKMTLKIKKGEVIFREGNRGSGLYCIYQGKVKIHKMGDMARDQIVRFAHEGEIIGYRSLVSNEPYNASATALEESYVCYIPKATFIDILSHNHKVALNTIKQLAKDLKDSEERIVNITQKSAIERLSLSLLSLKDIFGLKEDQRTLNVSLKRSEIGELAGLTPETTIRTLSDMKKQGLIKLVGKQIQILDHNTLRIISGGQE